MERIEKDTARGAVLQWTARARSDDTTRAAMMTVQIEAEAEAEADGYVVVATDGYVVVATDGRRMHIATTTYMALPVGTWEYNETKDSIILTESDTTFCNWRRVVPEDTEVVSEYQANKHTKKNVSQFSLALFKFARETQVTVNLAYLSDLADKYVAFWKVRMTKTDEGANDVHKAIVLTADEAFRGSARKAIIMPMQLD